MFNLKFDWKTIVAIVLIIIVSLLGWKLFHDSNKVKEQTQIIQNLEKINKSQEDSIKRQQILMASQEESLKRSYEIERGYNEKIKILEANISTNTSISNSVYKQIDNLRNKNNSTAASNEALVQRVDVLSGLLETVSRGYEKSAESSSRAKIEFEKCNAFIDEIYFSNEKLKKDL